MATGTYLSIYYASKIHMPFIMVMGFVLFVICPLLLMNFTKKYFMKSADLTFRDDSFNITTFKYNTDIFIDESTIFYKDLEKCSVRSSSPKSSSINFSFFNGKKINYSFINEESSSNLLRENENNISFLIYQEVYTHNRNVVLTRPFYATKVGAVSIVIISLMMLVSLIGAVIYKPSLILLSIIPVSSIFIGIIIQRKREMHNFNKYQSKSASL